MAEPNDLQEDVLAQLRARADELEQQLGRVQREAESRLILAEVKAEAIRAGIIDLDGLKLMDLTAVKFTENGEVDGVAANIARLRRDKPWLFASPSSSSTVAPPPAHSPRTKRATEMTDAEYRAARAELLKRRF